MLTKPIDREARIINVPGEYTTIQEALNAAESGYTILVAPGTYKENIKWPNTNGIGLIGSGQDKTIIDGDKKERVISFGWRLDGIDHTTNIHDLSIINGRGGVYLSNSSPTFKNVTISNNTSSNNGGGILMRSSNPILENVSIYNNSSTNFGGGICMINSNPVFSEKYRCKIYSNNAMSGNDIYFDILDKRKEDSINVLSRNNIYYYSSKKYHLPLDVFTVKSPTTYHVFPLEIFSFDILSGQFQQIDADIYVSPDGDNQNSGISFNSPLQSISCALSKIMANNKNIIQYILIQELTILA
ncbi:MAG: hypothetical protein OMM_04105 [Candidatus Magnetoglobus multicellularis str. Araruama]|uniref:Uncharacterized protein n=1 Tax=Candidatus Magnetoglobus multicellularis str. Araruama TaxID=890399 RepID=A0A1V1P2X5_9BACT|nr:MAG: hypothetical protein OMM_04105 [Candidatus Magnetoglobus multicellularis str. Araruama]